MINDNVLKLFKESELFIFDLDGTLVNSRKDISLGITHALREIGLPEKNEDEIAQLLFQGSKGVIKDALGSYHNHFDQVFKVFSKYYQDHLLDHTEYYEGVPELLQFLKDKKLAILSNKRERFCRKIVEGLDPKHSFLSILGGDSFAEKKPDPMGVLHLCKTFNVEPSKAWMIGDSPVDVEAGEKAGVHTLAVLNGFTSHEIMAKTSATLIIPHLNDLTKAWHP